MAKLIYEEDLYDNAPEPSTLQPAKNEPQKPSYTKKTRKPKKQRKPFKQLLKDDVYIRRFATAVAVIGILIWATISSFGNIGTNILNSIIRGLGFENIAQFETVLGELNNPYQPTITTSLNDVAEDNLFKLFNNSINGQVLENDIVVEMIGWDGAIKVSYDLGKIVFKINLDKLKAELAKLEVTAPSAIYVSFYFNWGNDYITEVQFNSMTSESNNLLINALGGDAIRKAIAESFNAWKVEQDNA